MLQLNRSALSGQDFNHLSLKDEIDYISLFNRHFDMLFSKFAHLSLESLSYQAKASLYTTPSARPSLLHLPQIDMMESIYLLLSLAFMRFSFEPYYPIGSELLSHHFKHVKKLSAIDPETDSEGKNDPVVVREDEELNKLISEVARLQVNIQPFVVYELGLLSQDSIQLFLTW